MHSDPCFWYLEPATWNHNNSGPVFFPVGAYTVIVDRVTLCTLVTGLPANNLWLNDVVSGPGTDCRSGAAPKRGQSGPVHSDSFFGVRREGALLMSAPSRRKNATIQTAKKAPIEGAYRNVVAQIRPKLSSSYQLLPNRRLTSTGAMLGNL